MNIDFAGVSVADKQADEQTDVHRYKTILVHNWKLWHQFMSCQGVPLGSSYASSASNNTCILTKKGDKHAVC
jgi:hypothetical protein